MQKRGVPSLQANKGRGQAAAGRTEAVERAAREEVIVQSVV
jgi:hypothetical protein